MVYVALLRGINVNGQKKIKMELLKSIFEELKLEKVKTYIQTGNVCFTTSADRKESLCKKIENKLNAALGFQVPVILRTLEELEAVAADNPFKNTELLENEKLHVTFLSETPSSEAAEFLTSFKDETDEAMLQGDNVIILCRKGYGSTKFSNTFLEKKLKVEGTTRNFTTLNKIIAMGRE